MTYFLQSITTWAFWRHALLSKDGLGTLLAAFGSIYLFVEFLDFFKFYERSNYSHYAAIPIVCAALLYVVLSRRPLKRFSYKVPGRDLTIEVKIGDLFNEDGDAVISSSTTFDTDVANGIISPNSLQGQLALKVFKGVTTEIDRQLDLDLAAVSHTTRTKKGKDREYPVGTVARVKTLEKTYYFFAMSRMNDHLTAESNVRMVEDALAGLWNFIRTKGELKTIVVPIIGTGRGRLEISRKKMVERIAQSFADASGERVFSNRLVIVIHPSDAKRFGVNLFEIRDYLGRSLHI